jgi:hypothetical protein
MVGPKMYEQIEKIELNHVGRKIHALRVVVGQTSGDSTNYSAAKIF